jgi:hypothetical protein
MSRKTRILAGVLAVTLSGAMLAPAAMAQPYPPPPPPPGPGGPPPPMYWHHRHQDWYRSHGYDWDGHRWWRHHHHHHYD